MKTISIVSVPIGLLNHLLYSNKTSIIQNGIQLCPEIRMDAPRMILNEEKLITKRSILHFVINDPFMFGGYAEHTSRNGWTLGTIVKTFNRDFNERLFSHSTMDTLKHGNIASVFILTKFELENNRVTAIIEVK